MKKIIPILIITLSATIIFMVYDKNTKDNNKKNEKNSEEKYVVVEEKNRETYGTQSVSPNFAVPIFDVNYVKENSEQILKVKILEKYDAYFEKEQPFPTTKIKVQVLETYKGSNVNEIIEIAKPGGFVTINQLINSLTTEQVDKMELYNIAEEKRDITYMNYEFDHSYNLEPGKTYVVFLAGDYVLFGDGYTVFIENEETNKTAKTDEVILENSITKNTLKLSR